MSSRRGVPARTRKRSWSSAWSSAGSTIRSSAPVQWNSSSPRWTVRTRPSPGWAPTGRPRRRPTSTGCSTAGYGTPYGGREACCAATPGPRYAPKNCRRSWAAPRPAATGAFHGVFPLAAGGVVLQATRTVEEYSDDAVRRVFEALHPVLPPEMPQFDPAHPELRYFAADASLEPIKDPISGKALVIGVKRALWRPVPSRQPQREVSRRADRGDGPAFRPPPAAQQAAGPGPGRAGG